MPLNTSQALAKKSIIKTLLHNQNCLLQAPAGFGKTFLLNDMIDSWPFKKTLVLAETNKAVSLLRSSIPTNRDVDFKTVCSALNYVLKPTKEGFKLEQASPPDFSSYDVVVLDEGSMLSPSRWGEVKLHAKRILVAGDDKQAPPIGESISPVWAEPWPSFELTIPMRNTTDIYKYSLLLRQNVGSRKHFPTDFFVSKDVFQREINKALPEFMSGDAVILALSEKGAKRQAVADYNTNVIHSLFGQTTFPNIGERIVFKKPYLPFVDGEQSKNKPIFTNSQAVITKISTDSYTFKNRHIDAFHLEIISEEYPAEAMEIVVPQSVDSFKHMSGFLWGLKDEKALEAFHKLFATVQANYSCNAFVCQGMTKKTVFVDLQDLTYCTKTDLRLRQILFYVMCSRASHNLFVFGG